MINTFKRLLCKYINDLDLNIHQVVFNEQNSNITINDKFTIKYQPYLLTRITLEVIDPEFKLDIDDILIMEDIALTQPKIERVVFENVDDEDTWKLLEESGYRHYLYKDKSNFTKLIRELYYH